MKNFKQLEKNEEIKKLEGRSDSFMNRLRVYFKNGLQLSVIKGDTSYGGNQDLFEIAPFNLEGNLDGSILNIENDDVEGFLTEEDVIDRINKMAQL